MAPTIRCHSTSTACKTATLSLSQKTYANETALAAEIQARINTDSALSAAGKRVTVTFDTDHYVIQSNSYGSESNISISSAAAGSTSTLGIATTTGTATAGLDVAGTIGGVAASGSGQQLTGNGEAADLVVNITGGTIGQRGTVTFARGVAEQLHGVVASFLNPKCCIRNKH